MTAAWSTTLLDGRRRALEALDATVRRELVDAAGAWGFAGDMTVDLLVYDRLYSRAPAIGGHWTLFRTATTDLCHDVAAVTVVVEFDGDQPVDLWVSGAQEVAAGACTSLALCEALVECGGPLRQVMPVAFDTGPMDTGESPVLAAAPSITAPSS
ncbi:MAG: hypothetical protein ACRDJE_19565 [Dehalococcoidia bacterium]